MSVLKIEPSLCRSCKKTTESLHPFDEGICDACLMKKFKNGFTLEEAKKQMCECCHKGLEKLYAQSQK